MSDWLTIREAAELFQVSRRLLHYMAVGRPASKVRNEKEAVLRQVKQVPYGEKTMYLLNYNELKRILGAKR
jgi:hypothetical protein